MRYYVYELICKPSGNVPVVVLETDNETDALLHEKARIEHHGFDNLLNAASHAFLGRRLKPCVYAKISTTIKDLWKKGVYKNGKRKTLGYFAVLEDAVQCADDCFEKHYGTRPNGTKKRSA